MQQSNLPFKNKIVKFYSIFFKNDANYHSLAMAQVYSIFIENDVNYHSLAMAQADVLKNVE